MHIYNRPAPLGTHVPNHTLSISNTPTCLRILSPARLHDLQQISTMYLSEDGVKFTWEIETLFFSLQFYPRASYKSFELIYA